MTSKERFLAQIKDDERNLKNPHFLAGLLETDGQGAVDQMIETRHQYAQRLERRVNFERALGVTAYAGIIMIGLFYNPFVAIGIALAKGTVGDLLGLDLRFSGRVEKARGTLKAFRKDTKRIQQTTRKLLKGPATESDLQTVGLSQGQSPSFNASAALLSTQAAEPVISESDAKPGPRASNSGSNKLG